MKILNGPGLLLIGKKKTLNILRIRNMLRASIVHAQNGGSFPCRGWDDICKPVLPIRGRRFERPPLLANNPDISEIKGRPGICFRQNMPPMGGQGFVCAVLYKSCPRITEQFFRQILLGEPVAPENRDGFMCVFISHLGTLGL